MGRAQFCKWEMGKKKKDSKQEKQGGNKAVGSSWKPVGQVSDFHCASDCCTCPSITVKCSLSCHWNHSGSSPRVNSLPKRKDKNSPGETEKEVGAWVSCWLIRKDIHSLWPGCSSEVGGSLPGKWAAQLISETKEVEFGIGFAWWKGHLFTLAEHPDLALCHCHTSNTIKLILKHFSISSPLGKSSQLFSSTLLFSYPPGKSLGKQKPCTAFWWGEITSVPGRFQQNATAVLDIGKARAESFLHWIPAHVLAEMSLILKQLSMYSTLLWGTMSQLPKCIFTQCSQMCYAGKDLSFNYPTQATTFIGILPKFI